jgi:2',3'-cyclic-nucleotide 2'-phosphodiesterase/3'-nucleotidase
MWEGIEYKLNVSRPVGQRVVRLKFGGAELDPAQQYDVVMNNYRAAGGGNFDMFKDKPVVRDIPTDVAELIANYIMEKRVIAASVDGNWEVVADA